MGHKHVIENARAIALDHGAAIMSTPALHITPIFMELNWEESLLLFCRQRIGLGHPVMHRDFTIQLRKLYYLAQQKTEARKDVVIGNT